MQTGPRKQQLLDAARACFVQHGFKATPVSAIVGAAGVAQGTFYLYFKNKQALITELRRGVVRQVEQTLLAIADGPGPVDERLTRVIIAMAVVVGRNIEIERVFRESGSGPESIVAARDGRRRIAEVASGLLETGQTQDPLRVAGFVVTLYDQILFEAFAFAPETVPEVVRESLRFTLRGVGVEPERAEVLVGRYAEFLQDAEMMGW